MKRFADGDRASSNLVQLFGQVWSVINMLWIKPHTYYELDISCAVHKNRLWLCGSRDSPYDCDSFDSKAYCSKSLTYVIFVNEITYPE